MPESPVAGTNGRTHAGGGERLRTRADDVVDEPAGGGSRKRSGF